MVKGKRLKKAASLLLALALCIVLALALPMSAWAANSVSSEAELIFALADVDPNITIDGDVTITQQLVVGSNKNISAGGGAVHTITIEAGGELVINADVRFNNITLINYGTITVNSGAFLEFMGSIENFGTLDNNGSFELNGGITNSGTVTGSTPYFDDNFVEVPFGSPISHQVNATNGPVTYTLSPGSTSNLQISSGGLITGTASLLNSNDINIKAENVSGSFTKRISFVIHDRAGASILDPFPTVTDTNAGNITARVDGDYSAFFDAELHDANGAYIRLLTDGTDYTSANGSTIVTLQPSLLQTLSNGTYSVALRFWGGTVYVPLVVNIGGGGGTTATTTTPASPKTGDASNMPLWIGLGLVALGGAVVFGSKLKRRMKNR